MATPYVQIVRHRDASVVRLTAWVDRATFDRYREACATCKTRWSKSMRGQVAEVGAVPAIVSRLSNYRIPVRVSFDLLLQALQETRPC